MLYRFRPKCGTSIGLPEGRMKCDLESNSSCIFSAPSIRARNSPKTSNPPIVHFRWLAVWIVIPAAAIALSLSSHWWQSGQRLWEQRLRLSDLKKALPATCVAQIDVLFDFLE